MRPLPSLPSRSPRALTRLLFLSRATLRLCDAADKYGVSRIPGAILNQSSALLKTWAPEILAQAILHKLPAVASAALREWDNPAVHNLQPGERGDNFKDDKDSDDDDDDSLDLDMEPFFSPLDIPFRLVARLPLASYVRLLRKHVDITAKYRAGNSWAAVADEVSRDGSWFDAGEKALEAQDRQPKPKGRFR